MKSLKEAQFVTVRDFLMLQILTANAQRSGVLACMTVAQFNGVSQLDGDFVVSVNDHKTDDIYGPAKLVLTQSLYSWLKIYVQLIHPQFVKLSSPEKPVFISTTGEKLTSGHWSGYYSNPKHLEQGMTWQGNKCHNLRKIKHFLKHQMAMDQLQQPKAAPSSCQDQHRHLPANNYCPV